jgi:hypothetical protein
MEHVECRTSAKAKGELVNNDLQFTRPRAGLDDVTTDRTRSYWDRSRDRRPVFAVSKIGKTSYFDSRRCERVDCEPLAEVIMA